MKLDKNPFFRKPVTPWYDSNIACWTLIAFLVLVFLFSLIGIIAASDNLYFKAHTWFPVFLAFISFFLVIKILLRLGKRRIKDN